MQLNLAQNALIYGELAPSLYGRKDLDQYQAGCRRLENFLIRPQGGITRRPGTRIENTAGGGSGYRIVPFTTQAGTITKSLILSFDGKEVAAYEQTATGLTALVESPIDFQDIQPYLHNVAAVSGRIAWHENIDRFPLATGMGPYSVQAADATYSVPTGWTPTTTGYWPVVQTTAAFQSIILSTDKLCVGLQQHAQHFPTLLSLTSWYTTTDPVTGDNAWIKALNADRLEPVTAGLNSTKTIRLVPCYSPDNSTPITSRSVWVHQVSDVRYDADYLDALRYVQEGEVLWVSLPNMLLQFYAIQDAVSGVFRLVMRRQNLDWNGPVTRIDDGNVGLMTMTGGNPGLLGGLFTIDQVDDVGAQAVWSRSELARRQIVAKRSGASDWMHGALMTGSVVSGIYDRGYVLSKPFTTWPGGTVNMSPWALGSLYQKSLDLTAAFKVENIVRAMTLIDGRLVISGGLRPEVLAFSGTDGIACARFLPIDYAGANFTGPSYAAGAFNLQLSGFGEADAPIETLFSLEEDLFIVTAQRVYRLWGPATDTGISSSNRVIRPLNRNGGARIQAALLEDAGIYVSSNRHRLLRVRYGGDEEGYTTDDLSLFSSHLYEQHIRRIATMPDPLQFLFVLCKESGGTAALTAVAINREQQIIGAARIVLAGSDAVTDICPMLDQFTNEWRLYLNRGTRIESLQIAMRETRAVGDELFIDSTWSYTNGAPYTNVPSSTFPSYFNGKTVSVIYNNALLATRAVSSGQFSTALDAAITGTIYIGLPFTSKLHTLSRELTLPTIGMTDQLMRSSKAVSLLLNQSRGGSAGPLINGVAGALDPLEYVPAAPSLFSGSLRLPIDSEVDRFGELALETTDPIYPLDVNQIVYGLDYSNEPGSDR